MKSIQTLLVVCALWGTGALAQGGQADMRGLTVSAGGGVEGYSAGLAPWIDPGVAYGVTVGLKPSRLIGLELGYSGAVNSIDASGVEALVSSPELVRNGGQAVATLGLTTSRLQPYILGGIGLSDVNVRFGGEALGFRDDTVGSVPVGAGLRFYTGTVSADLRTHYNVLFDEQFAPEAGVVNQDPLDANFVEGNSYTATLNMGIIF